MASNLFQLELGQVYKTYYDATTNEVVTKEKVVDNCKYLFPYDYTNIESCLLVVGTRRELNPSQQRNLNIKISYYMTHEHHYKDSI